MINFVKYRKWWYAFAGLLSVGAMVALVAPPHLPFGLEYTGGSAIDVTFTQPVDQAAIKLQLASIGVADAVVQKTGESSYFIRSSFVEEDLTKRLTERFGPVRSTSLETSSDLIANLTFVTPVTTAELKAAVPNAPPDLAAEQSAARTYLLYGGSLTQAQVAAAADALKLQHGPIDIEPFAAGDLAVLAKFEKNVTASDFGTATQGLDRTGIVVLNTAPDTLLIAGGAVTDANKELLLKALDEKLGPSVRTDVDGARLATLEFTDPVKLEDLLQRLAVVRAWEVVGSKAAVTPHQGSSFLLRGQLADDDVNGIQSSLEAELGPTAFYTFDSAKDLAVVLNFGAIPDLNALNVTLDRLVTADVSAETVKEGSLYAVVGETLSAADRKTLLDGLADTYGPLKQQDFGPGDLAILMQFAAPPSLAELKTEAVAQGGLTDPLISSAGSNRYFIGARNAPAGAKEKLTEAFKTRFGEITEVKDFDPAAGLATVLDFGLKVSLADLQRDLQAAGLSGAALAPEAGESAFFVGAKDVAADKQKTVLDALQARFGPARQTPLDPAQGRAILISFTNAAQVAAGVQQTLVVERLAPAQFFLAQPGVSPEQQQFVVQALASAFGQPSVSALDTASNLALTLTFERAVTPADLQAYLEPFGYRDVKIVTRPDGALFVRGPRPLSDQRTAIVAALEKVAPLDRGTLQFSSVDAEIAQRSVLNTFWAVLASLFGIAAYLWWAFRRIPKSLRFGFGAIFGLGHDVLIILGVFGLLAKFTSVEFNSLIVVGILAIIGHSVNNTVIVFDRVRENFARNPSRDYETVVNLSLNETLARNVNVALTVALTILAVLLFGGESVRDFMLVLLVGVLAGLYSSLFLSANLLVSFERGELKWLRLPFRRNKAKTQPA